jgi:hypothetical protein
MPSIGVHPDEKLAVSLGKQLRWNQTKNREEQEEPLHLGRKTTWVFLSGSIALTIICEMDLPPHIPKKCKESSAFPTNEREYYSIIKPCEAVLFQVA